MGARLNTIISKWVSALFLTISLLTGICVAEKPGDYQLGTGDNIRIHVFQEDDLSIQAKISDTGTISYPLLGEVQVTGLTVSQLEQKIHDGLKGDYLINPQVSVSVSEYRQIFVNGEVKQPGAYPYAPGLTVRKAISIAGGFQERAAKDKIFVLHEGNADNKPRPVRIDDKVRPGDIITVEQSFF